MSFGLFRERHFDDEEFRVGFRGEFERRRRNESRAVAASELRAVRCHRPFDDENVDAVARFLQYVFERFSRVERTEMKPGVLVDPRTFVLRIGRDYLLERVFGKWAESELVVPGSDAALLGVDPNLQKFGELGLARVEFAMENARSGAHDLDFAFADDRTVAHAVLMFERAFERYGDDFHIVVRVLSEPRPRGDGIVVEHSKGSKPHSGRVVISRERERMVGVEPAVESVSAGIGTVDDGIVHVGNGLRIVPC